MGRSGRRVTARHHDGTALPVEITISQFGDTAQSRRMAVVRDCRPQQEAEALQNSLVQAESVNQTKSAFIARMSHELRTPLTVVLGFTELLQADPATATERARTLVAHIRSAGLHLLTLLDDLLDSARIERGLLHLHLQPVALQPLLDDLQAQLSVVAGTTRHAIELRIGADGAVVQADPLRLRQVLYNLLSNAIKYSHPGSTVTVRVSPAGMGWRIDVIDRGQGIAPDRLANLFKPFERLGQENSPIAGTGLGLATARDLVHAMSGTLSVVSEPGQGSTFSVVLRGATPAAAAPAAAATPPVQPAPTPAGAVPAARSGQLGPVAPTHLLCVDDNPVNRLLIDAALRDMPGLTLEFAVDGRSASAALDRRRPDMLLLDQHLPDTLGLDWLASTRQDPRFGDLPVVLFTADTQATTLAEARRMRIAELIAKPFDIQMLQQSIQRLVHRMAAPRAGS